MLTATKTTIVGRIIHPSGERRFVFFAICVRARGGKGPAGACMRRLTRSPLAAAVRTLSLQGHVSPWRLNDYAPSGGHLLIALISATASAIACSGVTLPVSILERWVKIA